MAHLDPDAPSLALGLLKRQPQGLVYVHLDLLSCARRPGHQRGAPRIHRRPLGGTL